MAQLLLFQMFFSHARPFLWISAHFARRRGQEKSRCARGAHRLSKNEWRSNAHDTKEVEGLGVVFPVFSSGHTAIGADFSDLTVGQEVRQSGGGWEGESSGSAPVAIPY